MQTLQPAELIVCDDNSEDETVSILECFRRQAAFPVRIVVNQRNLGSTRNFDQAIEMATGEFIALCDQDDLWFPEKLAELARVLEDDPAVGGVFSDAALIDDHGAPVRGGAGSGPRQTLWGLHGFNRTKQQWFTRGRAIELLLRHDVVTGATLMVRASLRPVWNPIPETWVHDGWIAWMLTIHSRLALVAKPLIAYRIHAGQQLGTGSGSRAERLRRMQNSERLRYEKVADQFEDLRNCLMDRNSANRALLLSVDRKIAFLRRRSRLPRGLVARVLFMLGNIPAYWTFARGWRSVGKDLFLF
jgi:glycosyltransferase involved in cell wall biosynthesis